LIVNLRTKRNDAKSAPATSGRRVPSRREARERRGELVA